LRRFKLISSGFYVYWTCYFLSLIWFFRLLLIKSNLLSYNSVCLLLFLNGQKLKYFSLYCSLSLIVGLAFLPLSAFYCSSLWTISIPETKSGWLVFMYPNSISIKFLIMSSVYSRHLFNRISITSWTLFERLSKRSISGMDI